MTDSTNRNPGTDDEDTPVVEAPYKIEIEHTSRRTKAVTVLKPDGSILFSNECRIGSEKARQAFIEELVKRDAGIGVHREAINCRLMAASKATGSARPLADTYSADEQGMYVHHVVDGKKCKRQITNWSAVIRTHTLRDDGSGQLESVYEVEVTCGAKKRTFPVPAREFDELEWRADVGPQLRIFATVRGAKALAADAIRQLSLDITKVKTVFLHTGWRRFDTIGYGYMTTAGAIHANGIDRDVIVELDDDTSGYRIEEAPSLAEAKDDVRAVLRLLEVAKPEQILPLLGMVFRSVINYFPYLGFVHGMTQTCKTSLCVAVMRLFGRRIFEDGMIGWDSTTNSLEVLRHMLKDSVCYIDDYLPALTRAEQEKQRAMNRRIIHGQANRTSRRRLNARSQPMASRPPRGGVLTTGEVQPMGQSTQARTIRIPVAKGDVNLEVLTECQGAGREGRFERAMGAFLRWIAPHYQERRDQMPAEVETIRNSLAQKKELGLRNPEALAHLLYGLELFWRFVLACDAMTEEEVGQWRLKTHETLGRIVVDEVEAASHETPVERFMSLLKMAIAGKRAYIARIDGLPPFEARKWGYEDGHEYNSYVVPTGAIKIGWWDDKEGTVYLEPGQAIIAVNRMLEPGQTFGFEKDDMQKLLYDAGQLVKEEGRFRVRKRCELRQMTVWKLASGVLDTEKDTAVNLNAVTSPFEANYP